MIHTYIHICCLVLSLAVGYIYHTLYSYSQLTQRKEEMVRKQREKIKSEMEQSAQGGATKDEQERLLEEHNKNLEKLVNKMDADKLRMESHLQV